jgi:hypothetical protein
MERCTAHPPFEPSDSGPATWTQRRPPPAGQRFFAPTDDDIPAALRELVAQGFTSAEAGNLAAYLLGLAHADDGWTIEEIERLLFVRHLVTRQRLGS